jgi:hypothetical protein
VAAAAVAAQLAALEVAAAAVAERHPLDRSTPSQATRTAAAEEEEELPAAVSRQETADQAS